MVNGPPFKTGFDITQASEIAHKIDNPFWKNTAETMVKLLQNRKPNCLREILATPMWHNPVLKIQYKKEWNIKGTDLIGDIMDKNLKIWPRDSFNQIKDVEVNFIEYESLRRGLVQCLSDINTNKTQGECPRRSVYMEYLGFGVSGCRIIYENIHLTGNNLLVEVQRKWERIINVEINFNVVEYAFEHIRNISIAPFVWHLEFKILHTRVATNGISQQNKYKRFKFI